MRSRLLPLALAVGLALFLLRHPIVLTVSRHETAAAPQVSGEPVQEADGKEPFDFVAGGKRYRMTPRFRWDQKARVMGAEPYRFDPAAALIPVDWALAWGPVTAPPYEGRIHFTQTSRFYMWGTSDGSLDRGTIVTHTANTHVIPATSRLLHVARAVSRGDTVRLTGWLVDVAGIDDPSFSWRTSVSRDDEGPGGCETVYLTRLTVGTRVYE